MTTDEPVIDKSTWGAGPWQTEPDRVDFIASGFACLALRHPEHGHFCGYVGVPREHALYGKTSDEIGALQFHGGITYTAACAGAVCHTPEPGMPDDVWWIGGDFAHVWDMSPGRDARMGEVAAGLRARGLDEPAALFEKILQPGRMEVYRNLYYVRREIEQLAAQLAGRQPPPRRKKARA